MTDLPTPVVAIPLASAAMCLSCEAVFYLVSANRCPVCTDEHFVMLEAIVGTIREKTAGPVATEPGQTTKEDYAK
jgi:hypothetical protein